MIQAVAEDLTDSGCCLLCVCVCVCVFLIPQGSKSGASTLSAAELLSLLRADFSMEDVPQSGVVSEETLDQLMDRSWMVEEDKEGGGGSKAAAAAAAGPSGGQAAAGSSKAAGKSRGGKLSRSSSADKVAAASKGNVPYPTSGVGYEVVQALDTNVLSNVNS